MMEWAASGNATTDDEQVSLISMLAQYNMLNTFIRNQRIVQVNGMKFPLAHQALSSREGKNHRAHLVEQLYITIL
jgi:hypothetical protein